MADKQSATTGQHIIEVLRSAPRSTVEEVGAAIGVARSTAHKRLAAAIAEGRVQ